MLPTEREDSGKVTLHIDKSVAHVMRACMLKAAIGAFVDKEGRPLESPFAQTAQLWRDGLAALNVVLRAADAQERMTQFPYGE